MNDSVLWREIRRQALYRGRRRMSADEAHRVAYLFARQVHPLISYGLCRPGQPPNQTGQVAVTLCVPSYIRRPRDRSACCIPFSFFGLADLSSRSNCLGFFSWLGLDSAQTAAPSDAAVARLHSLPSFRLNAHAETVGKLVSV